MEPAARLPSPPGHRPNLNPRADKVVGAKQGAAEAQEVVQQPGGRKAPTPLGRTVLSGLAPSCGHWKVAPIK